MHTYQRSSRVRSKQYDLITFTNASAFTRQPFSNQLYTAILVTSSSTRSSHITEDRHKLFSKQILLNFQVTKECQSLWIIFLHKFTCCFQTASKLRNDVFCPSLLSFCSFYVMISLLRVEI